MRNKALVLVIVAIICFSTITLVVLQIQQGVIISGSDLAWGVNEGDEFSFSVNVEGSESSWIGDQTSSEYNWSSDNVIIRIIELPDIPSSVDTNVFISNITRPVKIQCISTEVPSNYSSILVSLVSKFILPIGSWELLDTMFDDSLPPGGNPWTNDLEFDTDYFAGNLTESSFYSGQKRFVEYFPNWSTFTWNGWSNLETGIAESVTYSNSAPMCTSFSYFLMNAILNT